ncbi:thiamine pyrophosphate-dependent enzyme [Candidatus Dojkabacteria bacterium]|jgi:transketolase|nr:thiamine pyrophosphate-dependent enzyme [Candidatus Dojkabacteria bacterium]
MQLNKLEKRILQISYDKKLSHISSCLTAVNLIDNIYKNKKKDDIFILSAGHAGLALYCILEKYEGKNAEELFDKHGVHPNRSLGDGIYCSSGSLGNAITIAIGTALANRKRDVYVLISDGECAEGSVWEALRIASEQKLDNLKIIVNANSTGAYGKIDIDLLEKRLQSFFPVKVVRTDVFKFQSYLQGVDGHYHILTKEEYEAIIF